MRVIHLTQGAFIMKKLTILITAILTLSSCMMIEPSMFQIDNLSAYPIEVSIPTLDKSLTIKKNKSEIIAAYPQKIELIIAIPSLDYSKSITFDLEYMEKKRVGFKLSEK